MTLLLGRFQKHREIPLNSVSPNLLTPSLLPKTWLTIPLKGQLTVQRPVRKNRLTGGHSYYSDSGSFLGNERPERRSRKAQDPRAWRWVTKAGQITKTKNNNNKIPTFIILWFCLVSPPILPFLFLLLQSTTGKLQEPLDPLSSRPVFDREEADHWRRWSSSPCLSMQGQILPGVPGQLLHMRTCVHACSRTHTGTQTHMHAHTHSHICTTPTYAHAHMRTHILDFPTAFPILPTQETLTCTKMFCLLVFMESHIWEEYWV